MMEEQENQLPKVKEIAEANPLCSLTMYVASLGLYRGSSFASQPSAASTPPTQNSFAGLVNC